MKTRKLTSPGITRDVDGSNGDRSDVGIGGGGEGGDEEDAEENC